MNAPENLGLPYPMPNFAREPQDNLDKTLALAFFRIVQEGIHNAIKHSHATSMQVRITGTNRHLNLEVSDDGVGFDIEAQRFGRGLGLISMREESV